MTKEEIQDKISELIKPHKKYVTFKDLLWIIWWYISDKSKIIHIINRLEEGMSWYSVIKETKQL